MKSTLYVHSETKTNISSRLVCVRSRYSAQYVARNGLYGLVLCECDVTSGAMMVACSGAVKLDSSGVRNVVTSGAM